MRGSQRCSQGNRGAQTHYVETKGVLLKVPEGEAFGKRGAIHNAATVGGYVDNLAAAGCGSHGQTGQSYPCCVLLPGYPRLFRIFGVFSTTLSTKLSHTPIHAKRASSVGVGAQPLDSGLRYQYT